MFQCDARKVLAETQEPVAWMNDKSPNGIFARHKEGADNFGCDIPLYTTPPSHERVGLSDAEIWDIANFLGKNKTVFVFGEGLWH